MERVQIAKTNHTYHLFFDKDFLKLQFFDEEEFENPFQLLKFLSLSPSSYLIEENTYYDPENNLYHKYHNGEEDYSYFFHKNGTPLSFGKNKHTNSSERRIFRMKDFIICCSLAGRIFFATVSLPAEGKEKEHYITSNITIDYLKDAINKSSSLATAEKQYLYNEDFLSDILPLMNQNYYTKWKNKKCFDNISIVSYSENEDSDSLGYYKTDLY